MRLVSWLRMALRAASNAGRLPISSATTSARVLGAALAVAGAALAVAGAAPMMLCASFCESLLAALASLFAAGMYGSASGLPCTVVLASPAFWGRSEVAAVAGPMFCPSIRASLLVIGAPAEGALLVFALGAPMVWVLASPAFGGRSELPAVGALWARTPAAASRPASKIGR